MQWREEYKRKLLSVEKAASIIQNGDIIAMAPGPSVPVDLVNAISKRYLELENVTIYSGLILNFFDYMKAEFKGHIKHHSMFLGPVERSMLSQGNIDTTPYHFSNTDLFTTSITNPTVTIAEVSPPDAWGYMSYGPMGTFIGDTARKLSKNTIVQVNQKTPYVHGISAHVHVSEVDYICEADHELPQIPEFEPREMHEKIASFIVERIPNGATVQLGIGTIANAVGYLLESKRELGLYTEMMTNSMLTLIKKGVVTCSQKTFHPGKVNLSFAIGTNDLYDFLNQNIMIETMPISAINDPLQIAKNDKFVSINSSLMVDLTGQVCSESIGFHQMSGTGGQVDFIRGAHLSKGGMSFIALPSTANQGMISRICVSLPPGTVVTTPRTDVHYVVTEFGIADLWCQSMAKRVEMMISIAHPNFRDQLRAEARQVGLFD